MPANLFDHGAAVLPAGLQEPPDVAFAARGRLRQLLAALSRAAQLLRPAQWNEVPLFFFDPRRQEELEAARPAPPDRFAPLTLLIEAELPLLIESVEVRRLARALGIPAAASLLGAHCPAAKELAELLAVPDDEVFLALAPAERLGLRLHLRGVERIAQLQQLLAPALPGHFQVFAPAALQPDGTLPAGFSGCEHWLWPTQPLAAVPRVNGERIVLLGPAVVDPPAEVEFRFPALAGEGKVIQTLNAFQVAGELARLCGRSAPAATPGGANGLARAA